MDDGREEIELVNLLEKLTVNKEEADIIISKTFELLHTKESP